MPENPATLTCERPDCATLKISGPVGTSAGCPRPGCGLSITIESRPDA